MADWHDAAAAADVTDDAPVTVKVGERDVGLYALNGSYYALEDVCPHAYALLSQGFVDGDEIECPLHQGRFHVPTGRALCFPVTEDVETFPVRVDGAAVLVDVPDA